MSIFLSKFLPLFVYPLGMTMILVILAIIFRKKKRTALGLLIAAIMVVWVGGNKWVATSLARSLEWKYFPPAVTPKVAAIVVLGGGTEPAEYPRMDVEVNGAGDRVLAAYRLYKNGAAPILLLSGGDIDFLDTSGSSPAEDMAKILSELGVPASSMILDTTSQNTVENAINSAKLLKEKGITDILLVTSAAHMPRAMELFSNQGLLVTAFPVDYTVTEAGWKQLWHGDFGSGVINFFPSAGSLNMTTNALKEYFGMFYAGIVKPTGGH